MILKIYEGNPCAFPCGHRDCSKPYQEGKARSAVMLRETLTGQATLAPLALQSMWDSAPSSTVNQRANAERDQTASSTSTKSRTPYRSLATV